MFYDTQLQFLLSTLKRCHIQAHVLNNSEADLSQLDLGLRQQLRTAQDATLFFRQFLADARDNTVYKLSDPFRCYYLFLRLPLGELLFIGPYTQEDITRERILELSEQLGIPPHHFRQLETYYSAIPVLSNSQTVFAMLDAFGELIWHGENAYTVVDINRELSGEQVLSVTQADSESIPLDMKMLETRYAYENELIRAVSQGLTHKAELLFSGFAMNAFEQRLTDPVRNLKNYSIIMNTLLRKAAESGGVHPLYLDQTSTEFARRIESINSAGDVRELMTDIFRAYCRLVKTRSMKQYSPPVQKVIATIDSDLTGDLSLHALAAAQELNASYLSALFRRETGETVTGHVNRKRIQNAMRLLSSTHLQVQTVAQYCGIPDVNYFSKLFKKHTGKTPREYRTTVAHEST